jgi:putative membrane protein
MKHSLSDKDRNFLEGLVAGVEKQTGIQIVLATTKRSDSYNEIPWKAFSLGVSVSGLIVVLIGLFFPVWATNTTILLTVAWILAPGILLAFMTTVFSCVARLFLSKHRRETETLQYAQSLFLSKELFATKERKAILLLISEFERQVVILPDTGILTIFAPEAMDKLMAGMIEQLKNKSVRKAFEAGLNELQLSFPLQGDNDSVSNELTNKIISEDSK